MFEALRQWLCRFFHVPPEPEPPFGAPESVRQFRASIRYFRLRLLAWGVGQFFAFAGIVFWIFALHYAETEWKQGRNKLASQGTKAVAPAPPTVEATAPAPATASTNTGKARRKRQKSPEEVTAEVRSAMRVGLAYAPGWVFPLLWTLKVVGLFVYVGQLLISYAARRLDYELRWYIVTDRSLRIRSGIWRVQEMTMSFANLQQITVSNGPLQRLLGIADVCVQSAGGSSVGHHDHGGHRSLHTGYFHGVDNAPEIRDLIIERLRRFRETGLGDPDEAKASTTVHAPGAVAGANALAAVQELLGEAQALRRALQT